MKTVMNKHRLLVCLLIVAGVFAHSEGGHAGGIEVPDLGTVALGRGTAFVARADNLSAFYYNPAGLTKSKGPNLLLGSNLVNPRISYLRKGNDTLIWSDENGIDYGKACDPAMGDICVDDPSQNYLDVSFGEGVFDPVDYESASLQRRIGPAPMLVFNWGDVFNVEGLALTAGLITPSGFGMPKYPENGPQRYVMREANQLIVYPGAGVAYAFNRYIQVGGVFLSGISSIEMSRAVRLLSPLGHSGHNENLGGDVGFQIKVMDLFMPTGIIGVLSNPLDWLEIGASVRLPVVVDAEGKITEFIAPPVEAPDAHLPAGRDNVSLKLNLPLVLRVGARYIHRYFDIEADFVWERWSSLQETEITTNAKVLATNPDLDSEFPKVNKVPMHFRDTYSVRLGGDVEVWPEHIAVRAGGYYQSSAYPENNETFSLFAPFGEQIGVGGGLTWHACDFLDVNAAYLHVFQFDVTVDEGIVQQMALPYREMNPETGETAAEIETGNIVNNGTYEVSMNIFGVSLEGHF
ncbi:MAG: hypothetical protein GY854_33800 [Deltaproteobacteria bacterium]|nr:hypothetical protein [Deltaproteobacteria bacterium]